MEMSKGIMMILFSESFVTFAKILNGNKIDMQIRIRPHFIAVHTCLGIKIRIELCVPIFSCFRPFILQIVKVNFISYELIKSLFAAQLDFYCLLSK